MEALELETNKSVRGTNDRDKCEGTNAQKRKQFAKEQIYGGGGGESVRNQFFDDNTIYHTVLVLSSSDPEVLK
jgi:hypothetical protein